MSWFRLSNPRWRGPTGLLYERKYLKDLNEKYFKEIHLIFGWIIILYNQEKLKVKRKLRFDYLFFPTRQRGSVGRYVQKI